MRIVIKSEVSSSKCRRNYKCKSKADNIVIIAECPLNLNLEKGNLILINLSILISVTKNTDASLDMIAMAPVTLQVIPGPPLIS